VTSKPEGKIFVPVWSDDGQVKAVVNDDGRIPVQVEGVDVTIDVNIESQDAALDVTETSPLTVLDTHVHGYDGANWRKLQQLWGYTVWWYEKMGEIKAGNGTFQKDSVAVPANYIYVLQFAQLSNETGARGMSRIIFRLTASSHTAAYELTPVQYQPITFVGNVTLKQGDYIRFQQLSCTDGDAIQACVAGYKMRVSG